MIGAAVAVSFLNGFGMSTLHHPDIGDDAFDRGGRGSRRARQMGPGTGSLRPTKFRLKWRPSAARGSRFAIGGETHRAARFAPLKPCVDEKLVEPFGDRIPLDGFRARHNPGPYARSNLAAPATSAAARRSLNRLLVQEPMNTHSTGVPAIGAPAFKPM